MVGGYGAELAAAQDAPPPPPPMEDDGLSAFCAGGVRLTPAAGTRAARTATGRCWEVEGKEVEDEDEREAPISWSRPKARQQQQQEEEDGGQEEGEGEEEEEEEGDEALSAFLGPAARPGALSSLRLATAAARLQSRAEPPTQSGRAPRPANPPFVPWSE